MTKSAGNPRSNVNIQLPVKIDYRVLDAYLQKKFNGKILSKGSADGESSSDHARIRKISLRRSELEDFDLALHLQLTLLTTLFKNKEIDAVVHLDVEFREAEQEVYIHHYEFEGENNWFIDRLLETFLNSIVYSTLKKRMKMGLDEIIEKQLSTFNAKLTDGLEVRQGTWLSGKFNSFKVKEIVPGRDYLLVSLEISGNNVLDIKDISF